PQVDHGDSGERGVTRVEVTAEGRSGDGAAAGSKLRRPRPTSSQSLPAGGTHHPEATVLLCAIPFPHTPRSVTRRLISVSAAVLMLAGGGDSSGPDDDGDDTPPAGEVGTLSGTVRSAVPPAVLEGATVRIGSRLTTSDGNGQYSFADVPVGPVT